MMEFLFIFGGCVIVLGIACIVSTVAVKRDGQGMGNWPKVAGQVLRAFVYRHERKTSKETTVTYTPVVEYAYTVAGERYTSQRRDYFPSEAATYRDEREAVSVVGEMPVGRVVTVRYNPNVPQQAMLAVPKPVAHNTVLMFGVVNVVMGALMIVLAFVLI